MKDKVIVVTVEALNDAVAFTTKVFSNESVVKTEFGYF